MDTDLHLRSLAGLFAESAGRAELAGKVCTEILRIDRTERITYGELAAKATGFARWLMESAGIDIGEHVAIIGKNRADWDVALWGVILAGAVPVLIDPERPVEGALTHLRQTDSSGLIVADDYQDMESRRELCEFVEVRGHICLDMSELPQAGPGDVFELAGRVEQQVGLDETAAILCTSGTTGDPREVELTHRNLLANIEGSVEKVQIGDHDRLGHILPPHHSFGLTVGKMLPLRAGATSVYTNHYRQIADFIREQGITIFIAVPALFCVLGKALEESIQREKEKKLHVRLLDRYMPKVLGKAVVRKLGWQSLRFCLSGSAAMPTWVLDAFWRRGLLLYEGYGTTENSPVYGFNEDGGRLGSVGKPISTLRVKIVDDELTELPAFETGQIALGGPCIMKGYYKNPKATQAVLWTDDEGVRWLQTGDLGYLDDEGNLYITGRKKYVIVLPGGKNVNPELVEAALSEARFVAEVLVVPHVYGDKEEAVRAIVRPALDALAGHTELSEADLAEQIHVVKKLVWQSIHECQSRSRRLSSYEKISSQHLDIRIDEFEKTSTGKIRRELYMKK